MRLLILGGTRFIGRAFVELALRNGHEVTLFHRGQSGLFLFPDQPRILGDRRRDLYLLEDQKFDAVVDFCGYEPEEVRLSARELSSNVGNYIFISTISVYEDFASSILSEMSPTQAFPKDITLRNYGNRKAECERVLKQEIRRENLLIIRPTIVVGEFDPTNRFEKWLSNIRDEVEFSIPSSPDQPIQWIDVKDLCRFTLSSIELGLSGIYNLCGPSEPTNLGEFADSLTRFFERSSFFEFDSICEDQFPFCTLPEYRGIFRVDASRAISKGLTLTPLEETARRTTKWMESEVS